MSDYQYWKDALAGKNPKMFVDDPQSGFYRKPVKERNAAGNPAERVGWLPVAIFVDGEGMTETMIARVGSRDVTGDDLNELWSYVAANPISEETYRAVAERGEPFPDEQPKVPAANREVTASDNAEPQDDTPLAEQHATAIDNAIAAAIKKVTTEAEAAQALGSKNRIAELRLDADKVGRSLYDPPYRQYKAIHGEWSPIVKRAQDAEASLNTAILKFRESERVRIAKEQADADEKQRLQMKPMPARLIVRLPEVNRNSRQRWRKSLRRPRLRRSRQLMAAVASANRSTPFWTPSRITMLCMRFSRPSRRSRRCCWNWQRQRSRQVSRCQAPRQGKD